MELRCKVGDLAFIVDSDWPSNIGIVCRVVKAIGMAPYADGPLFEWRVESLGRRIESERDDGQGITAYFALCPDCCLRPIRPDAEPERIPTHEELTA